MKVLHAITSLGIGGAEKLLLDSIPIYVRNGIDTELLLLCGNKYPFYEQLEAKGIIIHSITHGNINKIYNPLIIIKIIPLLKKFDIIHVHLFPTLYWVAIAKILSFSSIKLIFTEHNTENRRMQKPMWRIIDSIIYSKYLQIISIGQEIDTNIKKHLKKIDSRKFSIINNGVDIRKYHYLPSERKLNKSNSLQQVIIQISSFREQKDQITLIKAMMHLPDGVILWLVGDGINKEKCEKLVAQLNLQNRVFFLGERTDITELLKQANIGVLSSHYEGFGLVAVEAMASGMPFIASDVPGLHDIVAGAGLLFPKGDEISLSNLIKTLIEDEEFYDRIAQACYERSKIYDINIMIDKYIDLYKRVIDEI